MANGARSDARRFAAPSHSAAQAARQHPRRRREQHAARLRALNEAVSVATRCVFQSPLSELHAVRQHLPELCAFVDTLFQSFEHNGSIGGPHALLRNDDAALTRSVFRDPGAQWLSRSAMESGVTVLLCRQLLQCADERCAASGDVAPAQLVLLLLCDQLFTPCSVRLGTPSRNCEWRDRKPAYHAMPCSSTWDALFPFLDRMAKRFPRLMQGVLAAYATAMPPTSDALTAEVAEAAGTKMPRSNCTFARVVGLWRLMESLGGAAHALTAPVTPVPSAGADVEAATTALLDAVLQFLVRTCVLDAISVSAHSPVRPSESENRSSDVLFADLLMDKFFSGLQDFLFSCARSKRIARQALERVVVEAVARHQLDDGATSRCSSGQDAGGDHSAPGVAYVSLAAFTAASCVFVNGLAHRIVSSLLKAQRCRQSSSSNSSAGRLCFLVGFCAHVDLVPIAAVLDVLRELLDLYAANASDRCERTHALLCVVYTAVHRTDAVRALRERLVRSCSSVREARDAEDDALEWHAQLLDFQDRLTRDVAPRDFYAMPLDWMSLVWREWLAFSDEDVASFVASYDDDDDVGDAERRNEHARLGQAHDVASTDSTERSTASSIETLAHSLAFRDIDAVFARQRQRLGAHMVPSSYPLSLLAPDDAAELEQPSVQSLVEAQRAVKKRRVTLDAAAEAHKLNVLLLPDVMERVCAFMSAKRLCRLALVCRDFAAISRSRRLWGDLFLALTARDVDARECRHDAAYTHDWRAMYQLRWQARRRLRKKQRAASARQLHGPDDDADADRLALLEPSSSAPVFVARLCHVCGCNCVLASAAQRDLHMKTHAQFACTASDGAARCTAVFATLTQLKKHCASVHSERIERPVRVEKPRVACGFDGCAMSYTSLKRLASHRALKNHHVGADAREEQDKRTLLLLVAAVLVAVVRASELVQQAAADIAHLVSATEAAASAGSMDKVVADDVPTADVLWMAAERIGKSSSGDEIQRIVDYLVNKHWFQTAGDLRTAQLATEEWHSLQIPSRLKIAVQHVLDEAQYFHTASSSTQAYDGFQSAHVAGYADYAPASHSDATSADAGAGAWIAVDPTGVGTVRAESGYEAYDYSSYYYAHDPDAYVAYGGYTEQQQEYSASVDAPVTAASYAYDSRQSSSTLTPGQPPLEAADATSVESEAADAQALSDAYRQYYQEHHAHDAYNDVVEAHAVVVEEAATYEEILAPMPQEWSCRQCTFLNPIAASFCEMCQDHISASPDMANRSLVGSGAAPMSETRSVKPESSASPRALDVRAANARLVSPALSPLYLPSAPSFDAMEYDGGTSDAVDAVYVTLPPSVAADAAKHLALSAQARSGAEFAIIHPTSVMSTPPPAPQQNYLALAFSGKAASNGVGTASLVNAPSKTDDVREHEETTRTSFSF